MREKRWRKTIHEKENWRGKRRRNGARFKFN